MNEINNLLGVGTIGAALSAILTHYLSKKKFNAEVKKASAEVDREIVDTIKRLLDMANEEVERQKMHRESCESKVAKLENELMKIKERL